MFHVNDQRTINFQSSDFKSLNWSSNPQISGTGGEIVFIEESRRDRYVSFYENNIGQLNGGILFNF